jgi:hypothetical protein
MDTTERELKHGAIEDLLQKQKPAASLDEEGLAAGISTIGLQTKRLPGAQRMSRKAIEKERTLAFSIDPESHKPWLIQTSRPSGVWEESSSGP